MLLCLFYKNNNFSSWNLHALLFYKNNNFSIWNLKCEWNAWKYVLKNRIVINGK